MRFRKTETLDLPIPLFVVRSILIDSICFCMKNSFSYKGKKKFAFVHSEEESELVCLERRDKDKEKVEREVLKLTTFDNL